MISRNICASCVWFREEVRTPAYRCPKHCAHEAVMEYFGVESGGFISGIDVFTCDYHVPYHYYCGDVIIKTKKGGFIAYVNRKQRKEKKQWKLTDNSKNCKVFYDKKSARNESRRMEKTAKGSDSGSFGATWCPF